MPKIDSIVDVLADDAWVVEVPRGRVRTFQIVLGVPVRIGSSVEEFWYCPCGIGFDGVLEYNRFGGPGRLSALINACKWLDARRSQLVDEPLLAAMGDSK